jgi:NAD(P)-dependent dehydrogenase (short-subunit alcohol dehydrogenase family)
MAAHSVFRPGATALISGGASGVGFAFATICRKHGMNLALLDINQESLSKALEMLPSKSNEKTETYKMDVTSVQDWQRVRKEVESKFGGVDLLMLNAGAGFKPETTQSWEDISYFQKTMQTNLFGYINGLASFLPLVQKSTGASAVIMTGSKQGKVVRQGFRIVLTCVGITNPPGNPAYNASKSAVKTLAEHLSHDMKSSHPNISVHLLIPGWTFTGLSGNGGPVADEEAMKTKKPGAWLPSQVAEYGYKKMASGKFYIICPDNDVTEELDQARMTWGAGDWIEGRVALSRWDSQFKDEAAGWIKKEADKRGKK